MNVLSLFDGISCGQVALNRAGIAYDRYYASEVDKRAIKVTQHHYPSTIQLGDVTKIDASTLPKIDLLMGGSPCQGFSFAGKQLNFDDPRSKLFFDFVRLKNELKPKWFLLENVRMKRESLDVITKHMGVEPIFIDSADFSAQMRKRWYWTNIPVAGWKDKGILLQDIIENDWQIDANYGKGANLKQYLEKSRRPLIFGGFTAKKSQKRIMKSIRAKDEKAYALTSSNSGNPAGCGATNMLTRENWRLLTPLECERLQTLPDDYTAMIPKTRRYHAIGNGWTVDVIAHIFKGLK